MSRYLRLKFQFRLLSTADNSSFIPDNVFDKNISTFHNLWLDALKSNETVVAAKHLKEMYKDTKIMGNKKLVNWTLNQVAEKLVNSSFDHVNVKLFSKMIMELLMLDFNSESNKQLIHVTAICYVLRGLSCAGLINETIKVFDMYESVFIEHFRIKDQMSCTKEDFGKLVHSISNLIYKSNFNNRIDDNYGRFILKLFNFCKNNDIPLISSQIFFSVLFMCEHEIVDDFLNNLSKDLSTYEIVICEFSLSDMERAELWYNQASFYAQEDVSNLNHPSNSFKIQSSMLVNSIRARRSVENIRKHFEHLVRLKMVTNDFFYDIVSALINDFLLIKATHLVDTKFDHFLFLIDLVSFCNKCELKFSTKSYNIYMDALYQFGHYGLAGKIFKEILNTDLSTYECIIHGQATAGNMSLAEDIYSRACTMLKSYNHFRHITNHPLTSILIQKAMFIGWIKARGNTDIILKYFNQLLNLYTLEAPSITPAAFSTILNVLIETSISSKSLYLSDASPTISYYTLLSKLVSYLRDHKFEFGMDENNIYIKALFTFDQPMLADEFFQSIDKPDMRTFEIVIDEWCTKGNMAAAEKWYNYACKAYESGNNFNLSDPSFSINIQDSMLNGWINSDGKINNVLKYYYQWSSISKSLVKYYSTITNIMNFVVISKNTLFLYEIWSCLLSVFASPVFKENESHLFKFLNLMLYLGEISDFVRVNEFLKLAHQNCGSIFGEFSETLCLNLSQRGFLHFSLWIFILYPPKKIATSLHELLTSRIENNFPESNSIEDDSRKLESYCLALVRLSCFDKPLMEVLCNTQVTLQVSTSFFESYLRESLRHQNLPCFYFMFELICSLGFAFDEMYVFIAMLHLQIFNTNVSAECISILNRKFVFNSFNNLDDSQMNQLVALFGCYQYSNDINSAMNLFQQIMSSSNFFNGSIAHLSSKQLIFYGKIFNSVTALCCNLKCFQEAVILWNGLPRYFKTNPDLWPLYTDIAVLLIEHYLEGKFIDKALEILSEFEASWLQNLVKNVGVSISTRPYESLLRYFIRHSLLNLVLVVLDRLKLVYFDHNFEINMFSLLIIAKLKFPSCDTFNYLINPSHFDKWGYSLVETVAKLGENLNYANVVFRDLVTKLGQERVLYQVEIAQNANIIRVNLSNCQQMVSVICLHSILQRFKLLKNVQLPLYSIISKSTSHSNSSTESDINTYSWENVSSFPESVSQIIVSASCLQPYYLNDVVYLALGSYLQIFKEKYQLKYTVSSDGYCIEVPSGHSRPKIL